MYTADNFILMEFGIAFSMYTSTLSNTVTNTYSRPLQDGEGKKANVERENGISKLVNNIGIMWIHG